MWVKNASASAKNFYLYLYNSTGNLHRVSGTTVTLLAKDGTTYTRTSKEPSIPSGFEGWVIFPKETLYKQGLWEINTLSKITLDFGNVTDAVWYFDSFGFYRDLEQFKADVTKHDFGDVTADYSINSADMVSLRLHLMNSDTEETAKNPDVNYDTYVDVLDLVALKKKLAK